MINRFSQFLVEEERTVYFTFGRMNPPTIGHGKLLDKLAAAAGKNDYKVFLSQSQDPKKNPLSYADKVKAARKMFPKHSRNILMNKGIKSVFDAAVTLHNQGYRRVVMVVGSDRIREFDILLNKYNGKDGKHGFYNFESVKVASAGERDPDAEGVEGMSASKMRAAASDKDFVTFSQGLPKSISNKDAKNLFNNVRKGMGLKEAREFKNHIQLQKVSETRERFVNGELFTEGEEVIIKKTNEVGTISVIGANYIIVETADRKTRQWLDAVEKIEERAPDWGTPESVRKAKEMTPGETIEAQDPDIKHLPGSQPKGYHAGLSKAKKIARDRHFKKYAEKPGSSKTDSDSNYRDAPGDIDKDGKRVKTKTSKHTLKYRKMFGEQDSRVDMAKKRIEREKMMDKRKHDRMMDRARTRDTQMKNRQTK